MKILRASEKTLELNVGENILRNIRTHHNSAFLQGITLRNEPRTGLDVSIDLTANISAVGLQFKKPKKSRNGIFEFQINNNRAHDQHWKLYAGSLLSKFGLNIQVRYAFPVLFDLIDVATISPNFISKTYFVDPMNISYDILDKNPHTVEINTNNDIMIVHSKEYKITKFTKGNAFIDEIIKDEKLNKIIQKEKTQKNMESKEICECPPIKWKLFQEELPKEISNKKQKFSSILEKKWNVKLQGISWNY